MGIMRMDEKTNAAFDTLGIAMASLSLVRLNLNILGKTARESAVQIDHRFAADIGLTEDAARRVEILIIEVIDLLTEATMKREEPQA